MDSALHVAFRKPFFMSILVSPKALDPREKITDETEPTSTGTTADEMETADDDSDDMDDDMNTDADDDE